MCVVSIPFLCSPPDKQSKDGQIILLKLITLKQEVVDRHESQSPKRISWITRYILPGYLLPLSTLSPGHNDVRVIFSGRADYRTEFEQLLGGKIEDNRATSHSGSTAPTLSLPDPQSPEAVQGAQEMEGIEPKVPERPVGNLPW